MEKLKNAWPVARCSVVLSPAEVHLWAANLDLPAAASSLVQPPLSDDEIVRAKRFRFERDRKVFAITRLALRRVIARYVPFSPEQIQFSYQRNGKPQIAVAQNQIGLNFNISHSEKLAIIAVSLGRRIGIDVERYRTIEFLEIASRYFSDCEYRELSMLPQDELRNSFFAYWTRKEALLKAIGKGIGTLLPQVLVTAGHFDVPELRRSDIDGPLHWSLIDIPLHDDYAAALAFERGPIEVRQWRFVM